MRGSRKMLSLSLVGFFCLMSASSPREALPQASERKADCRHAVFEGEVSLGKGYAVPIGNGLKLFLQPIHSGWILRVVPVSGASGSHDYAELATPPYDSVTPLSISTDFSFRAQDAIGWNPRNFRFAPDAKLFERLLADYKKLEDTRGSSPEGVERSIAGIVSQAATGRFQILDARLVPGAADQGPMAAAVASHFASTAHTVEAPVDGKATPLGRIEWMRFRVALDLPPGFRENSALKTTVRPCSSPQPPPRTRS